MTEPEVDYGERLRRALHAAADGVVPSADGLERIQGRIVQKRSRGVLLLLLGWLRSAGGDFRYLIAEVRSQLPPIAPALRRSVLPLIVATAVAVTSALTAAAAAATSITRTIWRSAVPAARSALSAVKAAIPERLRDNDGWLRPVLATAGAVLVAVLALLAIPGLRQTVIPYSNVTSTPKPGQSQPGAVFGTGSTSQTFAPSATPSQLASPSPKASRLHNQKVVSPTPCPTSTAGTPASPGTSTCPPASVPSPPPTTTPSPTPTPTPSPSTTTATPTPSTTTSPVTQGSGSTASASTGRG